MRYAEPRRRTHNEGDRLTTQGVADAEMIGRDLRWAWPGLVQNIDRDPAPQYPQGV